MIEGLMKVKEVLYDMLTAEPDVAQESVKINQQMALQISKTVQERGVFIYQNQHVIPKVVMNCAIRGMRLIDEIQNEYTPILLPSPQPTITLKPTETVAALPATAKSGDPARDAAQYFMDRGISVREAQKEIRDFMWEIAFEKHKRNNTAIAKCMKVSKSYVSSYKCLSQKKKRMK